MCDLSIRFLGCFVFEGCEDGLTPFRFDVQPSERVREKKVSTEKIVRENVTRITNATENCDSQLPVLVPYQYGMVAVRMKNEWQLYHTSRVLRSSGLLVASYMLCGL